MVKTYQFVGGQDIDLAKFADRFRWKPEKPTKTHVFVDYVERQVKVIGDEDDIDALSGIIPKYAIL